MFGYDSEPITLQRECKVVLIPSGEEVTLAEGTLGYITQALGGSFTVYVDGNLLRVAGSDADAIGKERVPPVVLPPDASDTDVEELVWTQLKTCYDPEIPHNIVDLGLIYECVVAPPVDGKRQVSIKMTLTAPGCGMGEILVFDVKEKVELIPTIEHADVELVFDPPWNQGMMSDEVKIHLGMF